MKLVITVILFLSGAVLALGETYTFISEGDWTDSANWDAYPGTSASSSDTVVIDADLNLNTGVTMDGFLHIKSGIKFTNSWTISVNVQMQNDGVIVNTTQLNLFGDLINNGDWSNNGIGTLIVTNTGNFYSYGSLTNNGHMIGYNNGYIRIEGDFTNNGSMTINALYEIKNNANIKYTNSGTCQFNSMVRLEGSLKNNPSATFDINPTGQFIITDNSKLQNEGQINIEGTCDISSQLMTGSLLGHIKVKGILRVKDTILEIL